MKKTSLWTRLLGSSRGQSLIEFAMVLPFLLVLGFAMTEFGRALWMQNVLTEAAGAGARAAMMADNNTYASKAADAADRCLIANNMGSAKVGGAAINSQIVTVNGNNAVKVVVTRDFSFIPGSKNKTGLLTDPFGKSKDKVSVGTFTVTGTAIAKCEGDGWTNN
jgi:Flp pilus assembly protein TadG